MPVDVHDTIAAIASATGGALRGILRLSGHDAVACAARCFHGGRPLQEVSVPSVLRGRLLIGEQQSLPCDLYLWPTTASYTRQPAAEFHTLGSPPLLQLGLRQLCTQGARLARPGEFTLRAFLAGRLDLTQAEAVLGVIDAHSSQQLDDALSQLAGGLSKPLNHIRNQLLDLCADLEAGLDFVEDDISFVTAAQMGQRLEDARIALAALVEQMESRDVVAAAPSAVLVGRPNTGKSSLLNALAGQAAAIVSEVAGTTRDYVTQVVDLAGISCQLIDTAGLDTVDAAGPAAVAQTVTAAQQEQAQLTLYCVDGSKDLSAEDRAQLSQPAANRLTVITKCDLPRRCRLPGPGIATSVNRHQGLDELRRQIRDYFVEDERSSGEVLNSTAVRCRDTLRGAIESVERAATLNDSGGGEELLAAEIRSALHQLGEVVGQIYTDDILDRIFSRFCIGK